jgi:diguanylate cyclase (GGDEF)-like protein
MDRENIKRRLEDVELLHRVGASLSGTLEMGDLTIRFHGALREIVAFENMLLVLRDETEGVSQAFAFDGSGARGEVTGRRLEDTEGRPEGLFFDDVGTATYTRDFAAGEAANLRLRLDFASETLPSNQKMVLLETICQQAGTALSNGHLYRLANTDTLTSLASRRYFERALRSVAVREDGFAVIMLDLDWFKKINDAIGHRAGDTVLRDLARILKGSLRVMDVAARYGGEEFVILLPATPSPVAAAVAERIRRTLDQRTLVIDGRSVRYTASFGVADAAERWQTGDPMDVVWQADAALLEAKRAGRNQVVTYSSLRI